MVQVIDLTPIEAADKFKNETALLVDVRTPKEVSEGTLLGAININSEEVFDRIDEFGKDMNKEIILFCRSGGRSGAVAELLVSRGFKKIYNAGGYKDLVDYF